MIQLMFLFAALLAAGLFFVLADLLKVPRLATTKAVVNTGRTDNKLTQTIEAWLIEMAASLGRYIPMDEYKKSRLANVLKASGIPMTPETYSAFAIVKALVCMAGAVPFLFFFPLIAPVFIFIGIAVYFKEAGKAEEALREKREKIEMELPRFVATIEQELKASRDVLSMLENYKKNACPEFEYELDVTCADMRSSSYEAALTRFEARINSPQLSDIVRGLIGVLRGDDGGMYFRMLAHDFKQMELRKLKAIAEKIPPKIKKFSFIMLICFIATFLIIICMEVVSSLGTMF